MSARKTRFDGLDVASMCSHLKRTMMGFKLANIYDGSSLGVSGGSDSKGVYMFKLADPSGGSAATGKSNTSSTEDGGEAESKRAMLLIESGVRFHPTTHFSQSSSSSAMPSPFAMKLRKHLRNLRLENVTQLGNLDRVVDFRFGSGSYTHHLILELYSQGNLVLTDGEYRILALLRTHEYEVKDGKKDEREGVEKEEVKVRVGNVYPVTLATTLSMDDRTENSGEDGNKSGLLSMSAENAFEWAKSELVATQQRARTVNSQQHGGKGKKKGKKKQLDENLVLKALLLRPGSGVYHYGPSLVEHCILFAGLEPTLKLNADNIEYTLPSGSWGDLLESLRDEGSVVLGNLQSPDSAGSGYILYKPKETKESLQEQKNDAQTAPQNPHSDKTLLEFQPHLLIQHKNQPHLTYSTFATATDEFFSNLSSQKAAARADAAESAARERLAKIHADQARRVDGLVREQDKFRDAARLVELHADDVDRALGVINGALQSGMDWDQLEQLVTVEQGNENPIALLIHKLVLDKDEIMLALPDIDNWEDESEAPPIVIVTVNIKESAHGNARAKYAVYRASKEKERKTIEASETALKAAEAKAKQQLAEAQKRKARIQVLPQRKSYWFEKFAWFITSDNYLVVAGKDAQQNEQLVKRYLRPGDAYLHAEIHGAATCVLRAKRRRRKDGKTQVMPLSDQALREAGTFTICRSSAWSSKMVTSAYWVESHQVSKTAPTGEYLTVGSFMIRGRKNFLPASTLEMGVGVLFRLGDDVSVARHANERRDFALLEQAQILADEEERETERKTPETAEPAKGEVDASSEIIKLSIDDDSGPPSHAETSDSEEPADEEGEGAMSGQVEEAEPTEDVGAKKSVSFEPDATPQQPKSPSQKPKELARGKRSKNKRAKKKYKEQDDEDRALAMMALHGGESSKRKKGKGKGSKIASEDSEMQQKAASETVALLVKESKKVAENLDEGVKKILAQCVTVKVTKGSESVRWDKFDAEVLEQLGEMETLEEQIAASRRLLDLSNSTRVDNYSASLAGIIRTIKKHGVVFQSSAAVSGDGKQRKSKAEKQAEKEAWQEILAEDGIVDTDGDDLDGAVDDTAELAKLTGKPVGQDLLLHALPVVAPYNVLSQYKYRVKLTPGSVKRGKASKQSVEMFLHNEGGKKSQVDETKKREQALIKLVNENEWVQAMIGEVRITSAGASKMQKKQKGKGKGKKR